MSKEIKICSVCGSSSLVETHHIVKRKQAKYLEKCKFNLIDLCWEHHHGTYGVHGKYGRELDQKLKREYQLKILDLFFDKDYYTREEISSLLEIGVEEADRLCKTILGDKGIFCREDIIRACMGGKLILYK